MRAARLIVPLALLVAALIAGCGSDDGETKQPRGSSDTGTSKTPLGPNAYACKTGVPGLGVVIVSGVECETGRAVAVEWTRATNCAPPRGASRYACTVGSFRCLSTAVEPGKAAEPSISVSCSRSGRSIGFVVES